MLKGREKTEGKIDVKSLITLDRYLAILLDEYPNPIKAAELAQKTGKSKPAISKIRDRLLQVCDVNAMLFKKGFVLYPDIPTLQGLFLVFSATGRHRKFLSSRLIRDLITKKAIHPKIIKKFSLYGKYFTENDTTFIFTKILDAFSRVEPHDLELIIKTYILGNPTQWKLNSLPDIDPIINQMELKFKNKGDLEQAFSIRDKFYLFIRESTWARIHSMEILKNVTASERPFYIKIYKHTIDFYLKRIFNQLNQPLVKEAKKLSLSPETFPLELGSTILEGAR